MADGRTSFPKGDVSFYVVSILARPWRTGAHVLYGSRVSGAGVSILARPWRTGAPHILGAPLPIIMFQSSPVHGGRAHAIYPPHFVA